MSGMERGGDYGHEADEIHDHRARGDKGKSYSYLSHSSMRMRRIVKLGCEQATAVNTLVVLTLELSRKPLLRFRL
jgi:hypothetical protein